MKEVSLLQEVTREVVERGSTGGDHFFSLARTQDLQFPRKKSLKDSTEKTQDKEMQNIHHTSSSDLDLDLTHCRLVLRLTRNLNLNSRSNLVMSASPMHQLKPNCSIL